MQWYFTVVKLQNCDLPRRGPFMPQARVASGIRALGSFTVGIDSPLLAWFRMASYVFVLTKLFVFLVEDLLDLKNIT